jgi:hypothetical protein
MLLNASLSSSNTGLEEAWSPLAPFVKDLDCCSTACVSVYAKKTQNHLATMKFRLEIMSRTTHWGPISKWHHRLLGGLWALCGFVVIGNMVLSRGWAQYQFWIVLPIAASYVATGIGLILGRTWARRTIAALV